jgi:hypothetical protein
MQIIFKVVGYWLLVIGYWLLVIGQWSMVNDGHLVVLEFVWSRVLGMEFGFSVGSFRK